MEDLLILLHASILGFFSKSDFFFPLLLFLLNKAMRKEYANARSLATAQAQFLRAHDEIRMATTRLHLKEDDNDTSVDALSPDELASASVTNSSEKFISMTLLSQVKGKLRYLKVSTECF